MFVLHGAISEITKTLRLLFVSCIEWKLFGAIFFEMASDDKRRL